MTRLQTSKHVVIQITNNWEWTTQLTFDDMIKKLRICSYELHNRLIPTVLNSVSYTETGFYVQNIRDKKIWGQKDAALPKTFVASVQYRHSLQSQHL